MNSSSRISAADMPPTKKKKVSAAMYSMAIRLWSVLDSHDQAYGLPSDSWSRRSAPESLAASNAHFAHGFSPAAADGFVRNDIR